MNVCHVVYSYFPFDPRVRKEVAALVLAGHQIDLVCLRDAGQSREEIVEGVRVHRVDLRAIRGGMVRYAYQYALFFMQASVLLLVLHLRHHFKVIHVHSVPDFQIFCALPEKALGAFLVLDLHEAMPELLSARFNLAPTSLPVRFARALETLSGLIADSVITVNESIRTILARRGINARKLLVVMNSPDYVPANSSPREDLRQRTGLTGRTTIVYAGGINAERDLETFVRAAAIIATSRPVSLLMFGSGPQTYRDRLLSVSSAGPRDLEVRIENWIPPPEVFSYLALTDVGVAPYQRNPLTEIAMPNKIFEYAMIGKPTVLADLATLRAFWRNAALFYEPGDASDLAQKIEMLLDDRILAAEITRHATEVYERHKWQRYRDQLLGLYNQLAGRVTKSRST